MSQLSTSRLSGKTDKYKDINFKGITALLDIGHITPDEFNELISFAPDAIRPRRSNAPSIEDRDSTPRQESEPSAYALTVLQDDPMPVDDRDNTAPPQPSRPKPPSKFTHRRQDCPNPWVIEGYANDDSRLWGNDIDIRSSARLGSAFSKFGVKGKGKGQRPVINLVHCRGRTLIHCQLLWWQYVYTVISEDYWQYFPREDTSDDQLKPLPDPWQFEELPQLREDSLWEIDHNCAFQCTPSMPRAEALWDQLDKWDSWLIENQGLSSDHLPHCWEDSLEPFWQVLQQTMRYLEDAWSAECFHTKHDVLLDLREDFPQEIWECRDHPFLCDPDYYFDDINFVRTFEWFRPTDVLYSEIPVKTRLRPLNSAYFDEYYPDPMFGPSQTNKRPRRNTSNQGYATHMEQDYFPT
jgi:hypothetical protein